MLSLFLSPIVGTDNLGLYKWVLIYKATFKLYWQTHI